MNCKESKRKEPKEDRVEHCKELAKTYISANGIVFIEIFTKLGK